MPLTPEQIKELSKQLAKQKARAKTPKGIEASKANMLLYYKDLKVIVDRLVKETNKTFLPFLKKDESEYLKITDGVKEDFASSILQFQNQMEDLQNYAVEISSKMANRENKFNRKKFVGSIKKSVGVNVSNILTDESIRPVMLQSIDDNVALIKTIPEEYLDKVTKSIRQGIDEGKDFFSIKEDILSVGKSTYKRARLIARDQTSKLNGDLNQVRQQDIGVTGYYWRTSGDSNVRESHRRNANKRFAWNKPPSTGHPSHDVNCRCVADPDLRHLLKLK